MMAELERTDYIPSLEPETVGYRTVEEEPLAPANGVPKAADISGYEHIEPADGRPVLAVFCFEPQDSYIGGSVTRTVAALARRRQVRVHLFTRQAIELDAAEVVVHPVGVTDESDLLEQVDEFARRAANRFLQCFPGTCANLTVLACEWSAAPALTLLQGLTNVDTLLSLHTLERQRSDMSSAISRRIEEIELAGLRQARKILMYDPATAEVAKYWAPECLARVACAHPLFPVEEFEAALDPGAVKARYQVGPVDPTIVCVGDLSEPYGPDILMKAMPAVLKNHPQARLIVVGDGPLYWPLRVYARYLLLEHAVRLAGSVEGQALNELIQAADVVAIPSRESTPWWPIQAAWAARRPVVATHQAAPPLVEHERDGVLVYPHESSLVWGIERVLNDADLRKRIGDRGREKLEARVGWGARAAQVEELLGVESSVYVSRGPCGGDQT